MTTKRQTKVSAVTIARDVLKWLREKKMVACSGTYFVVKGARSCQARDRACAGKDWSDVPLQPLAKRKTFKCEVCALGALFIAHTIRRNATSFADTGSTAIRDKLSVYIT